METDEMCYVLNAQNRIRIDQFVFIRTLKLCHIPVHETMGTFAL